MRKLRQPSRTSLKVKSPEPDDFTSELKQAPREDWLPVLLQLFQKCEERQYTFCESTTTLLLKHGKSNTQKRQYRPVSLMNKDTEYQQMKYKDALKR